MHIPKAAGSTLRTILLRQYGNHDTFIVDGQKPGHTKEDLRNAEAARRTPFGLVMGHLAFGTHSRLQNHCQYITVYRDPVDRILSHYYFILRNPEHHLYALVKGGNMSLAEYVASDNKELVNAQTRLTVGNDAYLGLCGDDEALVEKALTNLDTHFSVAGLAEAFDETLVLFREVLHWKRNPFYTSRNVTKHRPLRESVPEDVVTVIEQRNAADVLLYRKVEERFHARIAADGPALAAKIQAFKEENAAFQKRTAPLESLKAIAAKLRS